jgi:hypothetical protein
MLVYTAEVPQQDVYWDENDLDEHGHQGPGIHHPGVLGEDGRVTALEDYHDEDPRRLEGWIGGSVHLPQAVTTWCTMSSRPKTTVPAR